MNIDPLAEKRYSNNTYMYCNDNPVIFVDPNGMDFTLTGKEAQGFVKDMQNAMDASDVNGTGLELNADSGKLSQYSGEDDEVGSWGQTSSTIEVDNGGGGDKGKGKGKGERKGGKPSYTPPPKEIPEGWERAKPKNNRPRYTLPNGDIVEWDPSHGGEWERYNPRGKHKGVWSPDGETQVKPPVGGRTIDPVVVDKVVKTAAAATAGYIIYKVVVAVLTWECLGCGVLVTP